MIIDFNWFAFEEVHNVIDMIYKILDIVRIVVPIGLILMTTLDISKKVIDPNDKDGGKKIMIRAIAALIIFLLPNIINIVLKILNIQEVNIDTNNGPSEVIPTVNPTIDPNIHIDNLLFNNCPDNSSFYHKNDRIVLDTNINSSYSGDIKWSVINGEEYIRIHSLNNNRSVEVNVQDIKSDTKATILVEADGKKNVCHINLKNNKLDNLSFTNCPSKDKSYLVGSKLVLKNDIPLTFSGDIKWNSDDSIAAKITTSSNQREATIDLIDQPQIGHVIISVIAGEKSASCLINIEAVEKLNITNCPNSNEIYHVNDKLVLNSNIPSFYKRSPIWNVTPSSNLVKITPLTNGRSAEIEFITAPKDGYLVIGLGADSKGTSCLINVQN